MKKIIKITLQVLLPILLILAALHVSKTLKAGKAPPVIKKPVKVIPKAEVRTLTPASYAPPIKSFGTVNSYDETALVAQVDGEVIEVSPQLRVGLRVKAGEMLIRLNNVDYLSALDTAKANVIIAESALAEELVKGEQAVEDWIASGRELEAASPFVLRAPQQTSAAASLAAAQADVRTAESRLNYTEIRAPYDGIITTRNVSRGAYASNSTVLASILSTEKAEVRLSLTAPQLAQWATSGKRELRITDPNLPTASWKAVVRSADPTIDAQNQVSYLIAEIDRPYEGDTPLSVGTFINAEIPTPDLQEVYEVAEPSLVNDAFVWTVTEEGTLKQQEVQRVRSYEGMVYLRVAGEGGALRVVTRPLTTYRNGQEVTPTETLTE